MKTIIFLLGNRDLQIKKDYLKYDISDKANTIINNYFIPQNDGDDLIVNKSRDINMSFLESSAIVCSNYPQLKEVLSFPMIEATLTELNLEEDCQLIFCTSKQSPTPHSQDSFYFAETAQMYYQERGHNSSTALFSCNPNDFEGLVSFFSTLFTETNSSTEKVYISNSGGTPNMRAASHFAGIFKNFTYININSFTKKASVQTFEKQEQMILKEKIIHALESFNYNSVDDDLISQVEIRLLAQYANARLALDFETAKEKAKQLLDISESSLYQRLFEEVNSSFTTKDLELELYISAKVKFIQKSYGDYLWRLFTIHDNLLVPYVENYLNGEIIHNFPNFEEWNALLNTNTDLVNYLKEYKIRNRPLVYEKPSKFVNKAIFEYAEGDNTNSSLYMKIDSSLLALAPLRNAIAHNYKGINLSSIEKKLKSKGNSSLMEFKSLFCELLELEETDFRVYDEINKRITELSA